MTKRQLHCPKCRRPVDWDTNPHRPFCSRRCALLDLGCWVDEHYSVAANDDLGVPAQEDQANEPPDESD